MSSLVTSSLSPLSSDTDCFLPKCIEHLVAEATLRSRIGLSHVFLVGESNSPSDLVVALLNALTPRLSVPVSYASFSQLDSLAEGGKHCEELQNSLQVEVTEASLRDIAAHPPPAHLYARIARAYCPFSSPA